MADLIERDAAIRMLSDYAETQQDLDYYSDMLMNIPAVNRWIACRDRLPKYDTEVLTYSPLHGMNVIIPQHFKILGVTHWQPLPEPPESEGKDG